ncbi:MAG TPA: hypothetical protein VFJ19_09205 [Nocardioidaceae bacterium]|nr:hypothetical protein [Nocardioidaceae bacterium]
MTDDCSNVWCLGWGEDHAGPCEAEDVPPARDEDDEVYDADRGYVGVG